MTPDRLDPARTALLLFDFLNGHVHKDDAATRERYRPVLAAAASLLAAARTRDVMVAYACASHRPDGATNAYTLRDTDNRLRPLAGGDDRTAPVVHAGTWGAAIVDELAPLPADTLVPKFRWSAFHQTYLELALRTRAIDTLVLAGGSTDVGIASTAYAARDLDFNLVIASDACTSPEQDNHERFMTRVFPRLARVRTSRQVIAMLAPTGDLTART